MTAIQKVREALIAKYAEAVERHMSTVPPSVIRQHFREYADELSALAALDAETEVKANLTRPIIGIENRTAQEAFDIMCDRIRSALVPPESRS